MFDLDMGLLPDEINQLADEVRACRERLQELLRVTSELRLLLEQPAVKAEEPAKLQSVP